VADELSLRLTHLFLRGPDGRRAVFGTDRLQQEDRPSATTSCSTSTSTAIPVAAWAPRNQTGWSGLVALLLQPNVRGTARKEID